MVKIKEVTLCTGILGMSIPLYFMRAKSLAESTVHAFTCVQAVGKFVFHKISVS